MRTAHTALLPVLVLVLLACSKTAEPESRSTASGAATVQASPPPPAPTPAAPSASDVTWDAPASWKSASSPSAMRKATYKIPKAAGDPEDAELSVTQVGGGVEANIKRWQGQFEGAKELRVTSRSVGALKVSLVEGHGTFTGGGMPGGAPAEPKKNWALLGAIVESVDPPYFFKLTGPEKTVAAAHDDFDHFVGSLRTK